MHMTEPRLVQMFLSKSQTVGPSICEVSADDEKLYCNCDNFKARSVCKHTKYVQSKIDSNGGVYPLEISKRATEEEATIAKQSASEFRSFIIKYGKVEVF